MYTHASSAKPILFLISFTLVVALSNASVYPIWSEGEEAEEEGRFVVIIDCISSFRLSHENEKDEEGEQMHICHNEDNSAVTLLLRRGVHRSWLFLHLQRCPLDSRGPCVESIDDDTVTQCYSVPINTICYSGIYIHSIESECVDGQVKMNTVAECELDAPWTPKSDLDDTPDGIDNNGNGLVDEDICDPSTITPEDLWKLMNEIRLQWAESDRRIIESLENSHQSIQSVLWITCAFAFLYKSIWEIIFVSLCLLIFVLCLCL